MDEHALHAKLGAFEELGCPANPIFGLWAANLPEYVDEDETAQEMSQSIPIQSEQETRAFFESYILAHPKDPEGLVGLALCDLRQKRFKEAERRLQEASLISPHNARYHWLCAAAAKQARREDRCYQALRRYLRCSVNDDHKRRQWARQFVVGYECQKIQKERPSHTSLFQIPKRERTKTFKSSLFSAMLRAYAAMHTMFFWTAYFCVVTFRMRARKTISKRTPRQTLHARRTKIRGKHDSNNTPVALVKDPMAAAVKRVAGCGCN